MLERRKVMNALKEWGIYKRRGNDTRTGYTLPQYNKSPQSAPSDIYIDLDVLDGINKIIIAIKQTDSMAATIIKSKFQHGDHEKDIQRSLGISKHRYFEILNYTLGYIASRIQDQK